MQAYSMNHLNRRDWLSSFGMGLGGMALADMLGRAAAAEGTPADNAGGVLGGFHFPPKAKRVIYLFQSGGPSQLDLYDHKPLLVEKSGE